MRVSRTRLQSAIEIDFDVAIGADRQLVLTDLIAFRQIRIEIVLARENARSSDFAMGRQAGLDCEIDDFFVQHRQDSGKTSANRAGVFIGCATELGRTAAKNFRFGEQMGVNFQSDDALVFHVNTNRKWRIENRG